MREVVLKRVPTMFLKSKQSIIREKLDLKPQKGSLSLRQDLKSKTSKNSKSAQSESKATKTSRYKRTEKNILRNLKLLSSVWSH